MSSALSMTVRGLEWPNWLSATVVRSMESVPASFAVEAHPSSRPPAIPIRLGDRCELSMLGKSVVNGYVVDVTADRDHAKHGVSVQGQSKVVDLVECTSMVEPGRWKGRTVAEIAAELARPFGVKVVTDGTASRPLSRFAIEHPETPYEAIERAARLRGLLLYDNAAGDLVVGRVSSKVVPDTLTPERTIGRASLKCSAAGVFSSYHCRAAVATSDTAFGEGTVDHYAEVFDGTIGRYRPLEVTPEQGASAADCAERVRWEAATRLGQATTIVQTVEGWTHAGGELWEPNTIVPVEDPLLGVSGEFVIVTCTYTQTRDTGTRTTLQLGPVDGYRPVPEKKPRRSRRRRPADGAVSWWSEGAVSAVIKRVGGLLR